MTNNQGSDSEKISLASEKILAIDFGTKRIGLAVSHLSLALPLAVIEYDDLEEALKRIEEFCLQEQITRIVIGLSEKDMAAKTREFGQEFEQLVDLPVEFADETMTSQEARKKLKKTRSSSSEESIDHYAAALILEEWIDLNAQN